MLTEFGKTLRKLRLDYGEVLKDMAIKLGISSSYLSAIEVGKRTIPEDLIKKIASLYGLADDQVQGLERAKTECLQEVTIKFGDAPLQQKETALLFARKFNDLDEQAWLDIRKFFDRFK